MGTFSIWHWAIALLMVAPLFALLLVPAWRILTRAGFHGAWSLLLLVPGLNMVAAWVLAFVKWPNDGQGRTRTSVGGIVTGVLLVPLAIGAIIASTYVPSAPRVSASAVPAGAAGSQTGWTEEHTGSEDFGPWLNYEPPGTRFCRLADRSIVKVYPPGTKPSAAPANMFCVTSSVDHPGKL